MIASTGAADFVMAVLFGVICFVAGVAWSAYRAVGWVERIRGWAQSVPVESKESA